MHKKGTKETKREKNKTADWGTMVHRTKLCKVRLTPK